MNNLSLQIKTIVGMWRTLTPFQQCSGDLIFLGEQPVYSVMRKITVAYTFSSPLAPVFWGALVQTVPQNWTPLVHPLFLTVHTKQSLKEKQEEEMITATTLLERLESLFCLPKKKKKKKTLFIVWISLSHLNPPSPPPQSHSYCYFSHSRPPAWQVWLNETLSPDSVFFFFFFLWNKLLEPYFH